MYLFKFHFVSLVTLNRFYYIFKLLAKFYYQELKHISKQNI